MTSLFRDDVSRPKPSCCSTTTTSHPGLASRSATARPITPAPMTTMSTLSIPFIRGAPEQGWLCLANCGRLYFGRGISMNDLRAFVL